jgi:type 1 glutamine amidotransferase
MTSAKLILVAALAVLLAPPKPFEVTPEWTAKIRDLAPAKTTVPSSRKHKVLVFSRMTGYQHWVTPHTAEVVRILGEKTGAYEVVASDEVSHFEPEKIKAYDIIVLNNTCSVGKNRNLFLDVTKDKAKADHLEKSLVAHVASGKGLVVLHGAIVMQNNSKAFGDMVGGSFDFHPTQQAVTCTPVDPKHPLVAAFEGKPFVHVDEPYLFKNAYAEMNFRPLLEMDTAKLDCGKQTAAVRAMKRYVAWIKPHGKGRVFFCSPSHNAQSYEKPELLRFILDGIQYAAGDLECDDSPVGKQK